MREARRSFRISTLTLEQLNFTLGLIADRMDEIEGRRGTPQFKSDVNMGQNRITSLQPGSAAFDGATVTQVDTIDTELSSLASTASALESATSGVSGLVASATPGANRIVMSPAGSQYINNGWIDPSAFLSTQSDVTASRALGTVYQNTTGKTMWANVITTPSGATNINAYTDANNPPTTVVFTQIGAGAGYVQTAHFVVLPNNYYKVAWSSGSPTLQKWIEWY